MSNIEYEVQPNKLTTPVSYAARVKTRGVVSREQFAAQIAQRGGMDVSQVLALWSLQHRVLTENLQAGMSVEIDDQCTASLSIRARLDGPMSPLPADAQLDITLRPDRKLIEAVRNGASLTRIEPSNLAPQLPVVSPFTGDLSALRASDVLQIEGYRLAFNPDNPDEGAFLVSQTAGTPELRMTNYLTRGDRKCIFSVPATLAPAESYFLEVRARTKGSKPTGPLYTGTWNGVLTSA